MKVKSFPGTMSLGTILMLALGGFQAWGQSVQTNRNFNAANPVPVRSSDMPVRYPQPRQGQTAGTNPAAAFQPGGVWDDGNGPRVDAYQEMSPVWRMLYPEQRRFFEDALTSRRQQIERLLMEAQIRQRLLVEVSMKLPADPDAMRQHADALGRALAELALIRADMLGNLEPRLTVEQVELLKELRIWQANPKAGARQEVYSDYDSGIGAPGSPNAPAAPYVPRSSSSPRAPSSPRSGSR